MQHHVIINLLYTKYRTNMSWTEEKVNKLKDLWGRTNCKPDSRNNCEFLEMQL